LVEEKIVVGREKKYGLVAKRSIITATRVSSREAFHQQDEDELID